MAKAYISRDNGLALGGIIYLPQRKAQTHPQTAQWHHGRYIIEETNLRTIIIREFIT